MNLSWTLQAWKEYLVWQEGDKKKLKRINQLLQDTLRNPFEGIGHPEPLKAGLSGYWSRRVDKEHRLVYAVQGDTVFILQCRYHY